MPRIGFTQNKGQMTFDSGTAAEPSIAFEDDTDTGIFTSTDDTLGFSTGGTVRLTINDEGALVIADTTAPGVTANKLYADSGILYWNGSNLSSPIPSFPLLAPNGTAAAPSYSFTNDSNGGMYRVSDNNIGFSVNGSLELSITQFAVTPGSDGGSNLGSASLRWSEVYANKHLMMSNGSLGAPAISWNGDSDSGLYKPGADQLSLVAGGVELLRLTEGTTDSVRLGADMDVNGNDIVSPAGMDIQLNAGDGNGATAGGAISITAGDGGATGSGGDIDITAGLGNATEGGDITIKGGDGAATVAGGDITLQGGTGFGYSDGYGKITIVGIQSSNSGGVVQIEAGDVAAGFAGDITIGAGGSSGAAVGGNVTISAGVVDTGTPGSIELRAGGSASTDPDQGAIRLKCLGTNAENAAPVLEFYEKDINGDFIGLKAPDTLSADFTYTLPEAPTLNNALMTVSSSTGALSWTTRLRFDSDLILRMGDDFNDGFIQGDGRSSAGLGTTITIQGGANSGSGPGGGFTVETGAATGTNTTSASGEVNIRTNQGKNNTGAYAGGPSGDITIESETGGSAADAAGGVSGDVTIQSGDGGATTGTGNAGNAGSVNLYGGTGGIASGSGSNGDGGNIKLQPGSATGAGTVGDIILEPPGGGTDITIRVGTGVPSHAANNGSLFLRTDGTGPNLYVRENGAWVAK